MSLKIKVFGNRIDASTDPNDRTFELSAFRSSDTSAHEVEIKDDDLTEFHFDDETIWFAQTDEIPDLFESLNRSDDGVLEIPNSLDIPTGDRNVAKKVFISLVRVFKPKVIKGTALALAKKIETQVLEKEGLNFVDEEFKLSSFDVSGNSSKPTYDENQPFLLFIHGTGSSSTGSFAEMKGTEVWTKLCKEYGNNVLALEHRTWSKSPLENALDCLKKLPENSRLHVVSHSRGGLVGDILTRCGDRSSLFSEEEIEYMESLERTSDVAAMKALNNEAIDKNIKVDKFIRVACPAAGTTILSKRLDIYLNVLLNLVGYGLGQKANPIFKGLKSFLEGVVDQRNDPDVLPGLEAMIPDSPLLEIINSGRYQTSTELRIIAGSAAAGGVKKTLAFILTRLYFWQDNDYVVDTDSMFLGAVPRTKAYYHFVTGEEVDHFSYFKNELTRDSLYDALTIADGSKIPNFKEVKKGEQNRALPGGAVFSRTPSGKKPVVVILPGTMGSNLYEKDDVIWVNFLRMAFSLTRLNLKNKDIVAKSLVQSSYGKIIKRLHQNYDVVSLPYDWRKSLNVAGAKLKDKIEELIPLGQTIHLIGHSMGGLVIRDLMINHPATWNKIAQNTNFRCILLGTPWRGSYLIPEIFTGIGPTIKKLDKLAIFRSKKSLLKIFIKYDGLFELLPLFGHDFGDSQFWKSLHNMSRRKRWVVPDEEELTRFKAYKEKVLNAIGDPEKGIAGTLDMSKILYVAGRKETTVSDIFFKEKKKPKKHILDVTEIAALNHRRTRIGFEKTAEGDGSVPWAPTLNGFNKENIYYMDTIHGELANDDKHFEAIIELLETGATRLLSKSRPSVQAQTGKSRGLMSSDFIMSNDPEVLVREILGLKTSKLYEKVSQQKTEPLKVIVKNGHLNYASDPVMIGHFKHDGITSAESVMDYLLDGKLSERHQLGLYPGDINTNLVILPNQTINIGTIIIGLGTPDKLTGFRLSQSVELGCLEYVFSLKDSRRLEADKPLGISSLVVGSGYGHLPMSDSINAIMEGVVNANKKIHEMDRHLPRIGQVEFVELYKPKTLHAFYILNQIVEGSNPYNIELEHPIRIVDGARTRMPIEERTSWWIRITALLREEESGKVYFEFSAASGRAKVSSRKVFSSQKILDALLEDSSHQKNWEPELAKTIFELLIPNDLKLFFRNQQNILLILDKTTAKYPWELLHYDNKATKPICTNAGMIRQLETSDDHKRINSMTSNKALVIGDPLLVGSDLPQLPAAENEANRINDLLNANHYETVARIRKPYKDIVTTLFNDYKIIHIASHGVIDYGPDKETGILLSDNVVLTTKEINQSSSTPELVFINSCFLGQINSAKEAYFRKKYDLAANIGTQFIENGVKAVVVAGWAVNDDAALLFAEVFYKKMLAGEMFSVAIQAARSECFERYGNTNTWGAYHAYGDQFYRLTKRYSIRNDNSPYISDLEILSDLEIFTNEVKDARKRGKTQKERQAIKATLENISRKIDASGLRNTEITEREAMAYTEIEQYEIALNKYQSLLNYESADFTFRSLEQLNNVKAIYLIQKKKELEQEGLTETALNKKLRGLTKEMKEVIESAKRLHKMGETRERLNLLGGIYKRDVFLQTGFKKDIKATSYKQDSLQKMATCYKQAFLLNNKDLQRKNIYPLTNWIIAEILLLLESKLTSEEEDQRIKAIQDVLGMSITAFLGEAFETISDPELEKQEFWDLVQTVNILQTNLLFCHTAEQHQEMLKEIKRRYSIAWKKSGSHRMKNSELVHVELMKEYLDSMGKVKANRNAYKYKKAASAEWQDTTVKYLKKEIVEQLKITLQELIRFYKDLV